MSSPRAMAIIVSFLLGTRASAQVQIAVDNGVTHQVMEGFGSTHNSLVYQGPLGDTLAPLRSAAIDAVYRQVHITTGNMSLGVWETPLGWNEIRNDNNDPNVFEPTRFNWDGSDWMKQKIYDLAQLYGFEGYPAANVSTRWRDKWLANLRTRNYPQYLAEAAEEVVAALIHWRDAYGIVPQYDMLFNEPLSGNRELVGANSQDVVNLVKAVGRRVREEGFSELKFVVPAEETEEKSLGLAQAILADPDARQYVGAIAYHTYPYGSAYVDIGNILRTSGSGRPNPDRVEVRNRLRSLSQQYGIPVWMTEVSHGGDPPSFDDLRARAIHIHDEFVYADASAYFGMNNIWDMTSQREHFGNSNLYGSDNEGNIVLVNNATSQVTITGIGYAIGHYARWINKGAVRIDAASDDPLVQITAFRDDTQDRLAMVLINNANASQTRTLGIHLSGFGLSELLTYEGEQSTRAAAWQLCRRWFPILPLA